MDCRECHKEIDQPTHDEMHDQRHAECKKKVWDEQRERGYQPNGED